MEDSNKAGPCAIPSYREGGKRGFADNSLWLNPSLPPRGQPHPCPWEGIITLLLALLCTVASAQSPRKDILLNANWKTIADNANIKAYSGFEEANYAINKWQTVSVPHNWDTYGGYRRLKHGNRHGYAWYRTSFKTDAQPVGKRYFLYFEGVGSFATVWLNGKQVGYHSGGRTSFTLDVTGVILINKSNTLAVRADHPAFITTLPWVCGACSDEVGFSEGSQPMGIFRPVHLIVTDAMRIQPFGVHIWNDTTVNEKSAMLMMETDVKNYGGASSVKVVNKLVDARGKTIQQADKLENISKGGNQTIRQDMHLTNVHLWNLKEPYLYKLVTQVWKGNHLVDQTETPYGIRWISWPVGRAGNNKQFLLNGKPEFINGIAEYEHSMGQSHAFSPEQIKTVVSQVHATGFNAFRDAHQPHNLAFQNYWDKDGVLWWPQFSAHIWYDSPEFKANFKALLIDWVKERRNSPSNILWGLQNESKLPTEFARECSDVIRKLDPTASSQRKITTCNGGTGTDWDVPQNWTGTYGGDPLTYAADLQKQVLVGEYGAWRSLDLHTEGPFVTNGPLSENRMAQLMETKIKLAESVKDKTTGHFFWLLNSHENPGRIQGGEAFRELDRVGPINYKGLLTPWGEPTDAFYLYRANFVPKATEPMVYIVSHTWPNRWLKPGKKDSVCVYSNCDEVELFNDADGASLGKRKQQGIGTHFQWDGVDVKYNVLKAIGYVNDKKVAEDMIVLNHLPAAPHLKTEKSTLLAPVKGSHYVYRLNCGGTDYTDNYGNMWLGDRHSPAKNEMGSTSWTDGFKDMPAMFGSQRRTFDRVAGTADADLFQTFRYGRDALKFNFPVPDGDYRVELYFTEPWYGAGGSLNANGWRLFDVAVNGQTKVKNLDIFKEAGFSRALKKTVTAHVKGGSLVVSFPNVASGQAIISAIAISSLNPAINVKTVGDELVSDFKSPAGWGLRSWLDEGQRPYQKSNVEFSALPPVLFGAEWLQTNDTQSTNPAMFIVKKETDIYIAMDITPTQRPDWLKDFEVSGLAVEIDANGGTKLNMFRKRYKKGESVQLGINKGKQPYSVAMLPVTILEPATDLRATISYKTDVAKISGGGIVRDTLGGKKVLNFMKNNDGSAIFPLTPGVADLYALRIKYYNQTNKTLTGKMQLLAADGTLMHEESLSFKPVAKGKSGTIATTTGTSINAGNYTLVITGSDAVGLSISGLEVQ